VNVVPSPDAKTVSVFFDSYSAITDFNVLRSRKSCNIGLPIHVPNGLSLGLFKVDYRGYAYVPDRRGHKAKLRAEYFWAGQTGPVLNKVFRRGYDDDFTFTSELNGIAQIYSPCGEDLGWLQRAFTVLQRTIQRDNVAVACNALQRSCLGCRTGTMVVSFCTLLVQICRVQSTLVRVQSYLL
jgi:hypothetical protein